MNIPWGDIALSSIAAVSAVAAIGAWLAAHRSARSARSIANIERDRRHAELTPQFDISMKRAEGDRATLSVRLVGPLPLRHLDEISVIVVPSDDLSRTSSLPGSRPQAEIDAQVWGPFRFTHGADSADEGGTTVKPFSLEVGKGRPFSIERTRPPRWQEGADRDRRWRDQWRNKPMRLVLTCRREGFKEWVVPYEVRPLPTPAFRGV
ncbi:hypothetical protein [Streptomyces sp. C10-9-1]|uniref:hypothetical protein n=1 Tax=Streptomyces sp. C10-9-1 TaxID=1859285 RepID=UPI003D70A4CE